MICKVLLKEYDYRLCSIDGGNKDNAIPAKASAVITCDNYESLVQNVEKFRKELVDLFTLIDTPIEDEEEQKLRNDAKELAEYTSAKEFLATADEIIEKHGPTYNK